MPARKVAPKAPVKPTSITLVEPAADPELSASAKRMLEQAKALEVTTAEDYESAASVLQALTVREKDVEAKKAELWNPLAKLTKSVQALFNPPLKVLDEAKKLVSSKMGTYAQEQRNIALAAQARADQEADEARRKLEAKAERAEEQGDFARADVFTSRANSIEAPEIEADIPKVHGVQLRQRWLFEVTDASLVPREYLMVDERLIRAEVNAKESLAKIPGVRIWPTLKPQG